MNNTTETLLLPLFDLYSKTEHIVGYIVIYGIIAVSAMAGEQKPPTKGVQSFLAKLSPKFTAGNTGPFLR